MTDLATAIPVTFVITADAVASRAFYEGVLALPMGRPDDFATVYALGTTILRVTEVTGFAAGAHPVLGWKVDDIAATVTTLAGRGVAFTIYEGFGQDEFGIWTAPDGSARVAWFNDPDGNVLSLTQG